MPAFFSKKVIVSILLLLVLLFVGGFFLVNHPRAVVPVVVKTVPVKIQTPVEAVIGTSVEGRQIKAYTYGTGPKKLLFVGGIHGGYEWNAVLLAYQFIDYITAHQDAIPASLTIIIIPDLNPDAVYKVLHVSDPFTLADIPKDTDLSAGRFNADGVDLNRNFDCKWNPKGTWQGKTESTGTAAFSEPESKTLRDFILTTMPTAVVFWHSQANGVYASQCENGILPGTIPLMNTYAHAAGYPAIPTFDAYPVTGAAEDWLASINIPAITVELSTHESTEWDKNFAGFEALLQYYSAP